MKTHLLRSSSLSAKLALSLPGVAALDSPVIFRVIGIEGLDLYCVEDIRLSPASGPNKHFRVLSDDYVARCVYHTEEELEEILHFVKNAHQIVKVDPEGAPGSVSWCTFDGIAKGETPSRLGATGHSLPNIAVYHTQDEAEHLLQEAQAFWGEVGIHEDLDPVSAVGRIKITNPHLQPNAAHLSFLIRLQRRLEADKSPLQGS